MEIQFKGPATEVEEGVSYQAIVDGKPVTCLFSRGALEDVNPETADYSPMDQFAFNQERMEALAQEKILRGKIEGGIVRVGASDV